jgi:hypothetical protein
MRILVFLALLVIAPLNAYANTVKAAEFSQFLEQKAKAEHIAKRLFRANKASCPLLLPEFLAKTHRLADYPKSLRKIAKHKQNARKHFTLYSPVINSFESSDLNGLREGDILLNSRKEAASEFDRDVLNYRQAGFLMVQRGDEEIIIAQNGTPICPYHLTLQLTENIQAKAKGVEIFVSLGLIDFTENEHELALIIAHELAHLTNGHSNSGIFGRNKNSSLEYEADKIGLDYITQAGFDPIRAIEFWRRWSGGNDLDSLNGIKRQRLKRYFALKEYLGHTPR